MTPLENSERNSDPAYPVRRSFSIQSLPSVGGDNEVRQHASQNDTASSMLRRVVLKQHPLKKWMPRRYPRLRIISQSEE
jgi:hypothetical protein